jgi:hypothetical protein
MSEKKLEITSHHEEILKSFPELSKILLQMSNDQRISLKQYLETLEETWEESEIPIASELQEVHIEQDVSVSAQYLKKYDEYLQEQEVKKNEQEFIEQYLKLQWENIRLWYRYDWIKYDVLESRDEDKKVWNTFLYNKKTKEFKKFDWNCKVDDNYDQRGNLKYICMKSIAWGQVLSKALYDTETGKEIVSSTDWSLFNVVNKNDSDNYISMYKNIDDNKVWYNKFYDESGSLLYEWENVSNFYYDEASQQICTYKLAWEETSMRKYVFEVRDMQTNKVILEVEELRNKYASSEEPKNDLQKLASTVIGKRILTARNEVKHKQQQRDLEANNKKLEQEKFCKITHDNQYKNIEVKDQTWRIIFQWGNQKYNFKQKEDLIVLQAERKNEQEDHIFHIFDQWRQVTLSLPADLNVSPISIEKMRNIYSARVRYNNQPATVYFNKQWIKIWNVSYNWWGSQNDIKYDKIDDNLYQENGRYRFIWNFDKTQDDSLKDKYKIIDTETGTILEDNNFTTMHHVIREDDKIVFIVSKKATPEKKEVIILPIDKNSEDTSK